MVDIWMQQLLLNIGLHSSKEGIKSTDLVAANEGVAVAGGVHVLIAVQDEAHGAARVEGRHGRGAGHVHRARLLPAEAAAEALGARDHLVPGDAQRVRHMHLVVRGALQECASELNVTLYSRPDCPKISLDPARMLGHVPLQCILEASHVK